jgi:LPXTG-motif cell wall-anchored protein
VTASSSGSSNTMWIVIAAIAAVLALAMLVWLLLRRRRGHADERPATTFEQPAPPAPPAPAPQPAPDPTAPEAPPEAATAAGCDHLWEVDYDRGELGDDGVWRFPHRCRNCGRELMASDVADATSRALV